MSEVLALTRDLVRMNTAGGGEAPAIEFLASLLAGAGLEVSTVPWVPGRPNLVATWAGGGPLTLSGHVDTVPIGAREWTRDPFAADLDGGRLYGRGTSDMKGGVAAIASAAVRAARRGGPGFTVVLTAGEETGCEGAAVVAATGLLHPDTVLVLGEATGNELRLGHKGATWLRAAATGRGAHGSRPDLGVNAIERLIDAAVRLRGVDQGLVHPQLGGRTVNLGTISGGTQTNLVPDAAAMAVDVRTVPGADAVPVRRALDGEGVDVETLLDLPPVWSPPESAVARTLQEAVAAVTGVRASPAAVTYFTDAALLDRGRDRSFIIGPGDPDQPHTTDESVSVARLDEALAIYEEILGRADGFAA